MMKNEGGSSITGNSAIPGGECAWAWLEVWGNDEDFEVAS